MENVPLGGDVLRRPKGERMAVTRLAHMVGTGRDAEPGVSELDRRGDLLEVISCG